MPWFQVKLKVASSDWQTSGFVSLLLKQCGAQAVTFMDNADDPVYEPPIKTTSLWKDTLVIGLFTNHDSAVAANNVIKNKFDLSYSQLDELPDQDWQQAIKQDFKPLKFANKLLVCPSWEQPTTNSNLITMNFDPGLAFGTGQHPTTAMCLEWLASSDKITQSCVVDYGCGSGILSVASILLGAEQVVAIDIDPQALEATVNNAKSNKIDIHKLHTCLPNDTPLVQADIVVANILANTIIELHDEIDKLVKLSGTVLFTGILTEQIDKITARYKNKFNFEIAATQNDWVLLVGSKISK
jgi:ribosomal protein L11 methyltransferase